MRHRTVAAAVLLALSTTVPSPAEVLDGKLFDPGVERVEPAEGAPPELARLKPFLGDWDLDLEIRRPGQEVLRSKGIAKVTFMNRGHAVMERTRVADFDGEGHPVATLTFLAVDANGVWTASEGDSWTETISLSSGTYDGKSWVLHDAMRPGGGPLLLYLRRTYGPAGEDGFEMKLEISRDLGKEWTPVMIRRYQRRAPSAEFFPVRTDGGLPSPGRPAEAAQFDFLLGEFDATHWLRRSQGEVRWRSNATAVHALDGHAILEFDWHGMDPSLPDAATSILRLYNRSMRRWESVFLTNRSNASLHFGGVREGDRIVLHPFDAQTGSNALSQWIFFDARADSYRWKGLRSQDRGRSFPPYWTIDFVRKGTGDAPEQAAPEETHGAAASDAEPKAGEGGSD